MIMKYIFLFSLLLLSCSGDDGTCSSDNDCKGDRICQYGSCTSPAHNSSVSGKSCGEVDISCNCAYNPGYPGQIVSTSFCQSGQHQFFQCSGSCGDGYPWGAACYCN